MKRLGASVVVLLASAATLEAQFEVNPTARAQRTTQGRLQISGFVGGMSIDQTLGAVSNIYQTVSSSASNVDFGKLYGLRASWGFTERIAAEFNMSASRNAYSLVVDDDVVGEVDLGEQFESKQSYFGGNIVVEFPRGSLVPYATVGGGLLRTTPSNPIADVDRVSALDFNVGGGLKYWFSSPPWLGLRFDARYRTANDGLSFSNDSSSPKGFEFSAGASFRWF